MRRTGSSGFLAGLFLWLGLIVAALGWALLLTTILAGDATFRAGSLVAVMTLRSDLITVAQSAILSGFGLAIIGALRGGFAAFSRFFDAVLQRATPRPPVVTPVRPEPAPMPSVPVVMPMDRAPPPSPPPPRVKERNYVVLPDGSVEVETLFGTRLFATLDEAREFIR